MMVMKILTILIALALCAVTALAQTVRGARPSPEWQASTAQPQGSSQNKLSAHWEELSAAEFRDAIARGQGVCLLPFGILEKHGPHLPLITDVLTASEMSRRAVESMPGEALNFSGDERRRWFKALLEKRKTAKQELEVLFPGSFSPPPK